MADIRINALATTATTPASDDYLALDGTAQGTRKILATNIANNVTDVILGSSGPSVKSTLSARAPRQGLVFDGTATSTFNTLPAFGTGDFSVFAWVNSDLTVSVQGLIGSVNSPAGGFGLWTSSDGTLSVQFIGTATLIGPAGVVVANKWTLIGYVRSSGVGTFYSNGVSKGTITDTNNYSVGISILGAFGGSNVFKGTISPIVENRALSASEVVALYEAGAPARYDYNPSTNAAVPSGGTYAKWFGTGTVSSGTASSFTVDAGASSLYVRNINRYSTAVIGAQYKIDLTITGTITGIVGFEGVGNGTSVALAGTGSYVITGTAAGAVNPVFECTSVAGGTITITGITALGLLLAPDAYQAGGGLSWYDTSGNSATITLPASGVSWNVPSSNKRASSLNITDTTDSSSKDTGSLILEGGLGVEKKATFGGGINGTTTNDSAAAGCVGEYVENTITSGSAVSQTNATGSNVTSITLTAGDWDVEGIVQFNLSGVTCNGSGMAVGTTNVSASLILPDAYSQQPWVFTTLTNSAASILAPKKRWSLSTSTTIYLATYPQFQAGTASAYGTIRARRVR